MRKPDFCICENKDADQFSLVYLQISGLHATVNSKRINKYTFNIYVVMAVYKINA